jgi:hypothetical protein
VEVVSYAIVTRLSVVGSALNAHAYFYGGLLLRYFQLLRIPRSVGGEGVVEAHMKAKESIDTNCYQS